MKDLFKLLTLVFAALMLAAGCAKPPERCVSPEDNPQHHYLRGMELLEKNLAEDAAAKFERSIYCDDGYGPAHAGMAIVDAGRAVFKKNEGYRKVDVDKALEHLEAASRNASASEEVFAYDIAVIRVNTLLKLKGWLEESEDAYKAAMKLKVDERKLLYYDGREAAAYFMGLAYLEGGEFQAARDRFADVLNAKPDGKWNAQAEREWKRVDKILRALAGVTVGDVGREIAVKDSVQRADMAALLADELKIDKLFAGRIPVKSEIEKMKPEFIPADVVSSPFKEEVLMMMKWGVRGLEPQYDETTRAYLFKPDEPVTRKEFAFVLEDVLIKLTGEDKLASAFFGHQRSPFPDVPPTSAWYNAIMNVTTRNIMETELSGEFRPNDRLDGAEAILGIRVLRQKLNIY